MQIVDMDWARKVPFYTIHCVCDIFFTCKVDEWRIAECPKCGRRANICELRREWEQNPAPKKELLNER